MDKSSMESASQRSQIAIVTGGNVGIGFETVLALARKDIKVIMACRSVEKALLAKNEIVKRVPDADIEIMQMDLSNLASIHLFAKEFKLKHDHLTILINNAGILIPPYTKTTDGFESQMGVNYFGHFLLTNLLFDLLNKTEGARVISLTSLAYKNGKIDFENLNSEKSYAKNAVYAQSKLAVLLFAQELQKRINKAGGTVKSIAVHPGASKTNLGRYTPKTLMILLSPFFWIFAHSPQKAAMPGIMAALDINVKGGDFYGPTGMAGMKGMPGKINPGPAATNPEVASRLWQLTEQLTGQNFSF